MKTSKPNVQRYDDMGCPEQICRVDTIQESDDGDFVLYEDYEALMEELDQLRKDAARYRWLVDTCVSDWLGEEGPVLVHAKPWNANWRAEIDAAIDAAMEGDKP